MTAEGWGIGGIPSSVGTTQSQRTRNGKGFLKRKVVNDVLIKEVGKTCKILQKQIQN
jgi:hypothetical protein